MRNAIKTTMRYHLIPVRMAAIKKFVIVTNAGEAIEKKELLYTVGENVNKYHHHEQ